MPKFNKDLSHYQVVPSMKENGEMSRERGLAGKSGPMAADTRVTGSTIKLMASASYSMLMEIFMKVNGKMIKRMARVHILMQMELAIKVIGETISSMALVLRHGLMGLSMRDNTSKAKRTERASLPLLMAQSITVTSK